MMASCQFTAAWMQLGQSVRGFYLELCETCNVDTAIHKHKSPEYSRTFKLRILGQAAKILRRTELHRSWSRR